MKAKILGYIVTQAKSSKNIGTTLYLAVEQDEYRTSNALAFDGEAVETEYIRGDYSSTIKVGTLVNLVYGKNYKGEAFLKDILINN